MASMTHDLSRLADAIDASRKARIEAAPGRRKVVNERHAAVNTLLKNLRTARLRASHAQHSAAVAACKRRSAEVHTLLTRDRRDREAWRRHYMAEAATFMRDLTASVATLRDTFRASERSRATHWRKQVAKLRERLEDYGDDRKAAMAAWRGAPTKKAAPSGDGGRGGQRQAAQAASTSQAAPAGAAASAGRPDTKGGGAT